MHAFGRCCLMVLRSSRHRDPTKTFTESKLMMQNSRLRYARLGTLDWLSLSVAFMLVCVPTSQSVQAQSQNNQPSRVSPTTNEGSLSTLDTIVVTATRSPGTSFDSPYTTEVISSQEVSQGMYRTTPEALRGVPGVMVQKTSHGQGSPFIRGFTGFRNLLLIDGIRLNNSVFRDGPNQYWNTVDLLSINRLEVVKGPSSVLYGSDAIGGTINAITKGPTGYGQGLNSGGRLYYRTSSAERSHTGRGELSTTANNEWGLFVGATGKHFGDLQGGHGTRRQTNTGYDEYDTDFKAEYFLNPNTKIVAAHQRVRQNNVPRTHKTTAAKSFNGTTIGSDLKRDLDQERELTYIQLYVENQGSFIETAKISLSHQRQSETRDRVKSNGSRSLQGFDVNTLGFWAQFESTSPIGHLVYGVEYYHDNVNSFSSTNAIQGPVADDASYDLVGVFIQDTLDVSDAIDVILGARFNYARADANSVRDPNSGTKISLTEDWNSFIGSVRVVSHLDSEDHWNLYGGVSQGFRAPNLSDLTRFDTARSNEIETPAPGLDSEAYVSFEVGLKANYDDFTMQAAYFYTDIQDMIVRTPTGNTISGDSEVTKRNAGDGFVQGIELDASYRFHPQWTVFAAVTWMEGEVNTFPTSAPVVSREPLDRLMPLTGLVGLRWDDPAGNFWIEGLLTIADNQDKLSTRDAADTQRIPPGGTPGYEVFSIRSGWRLQDNVNLILAVENITNEDYRVHGSGQNEPGRNFVIGMDITF